MSVSDPLISLARLKRAAGGYADPEADHPDDDRLMDAIMGASAMIRAYTGLRFEVAEELAEADDRQFEYDGTGYLNIDECQEIDGITTVGGYTGLLPQTLTVDEWAAYPLNLPVKLWLRLPEGIYGRSLSPEMGFTFNLDRYEYRQLTRPNIVTVTALWGWPSIPYDVQQAVAWTALSLAETPKPYTQESIEGYSRTRGPEEDAIPQRAQVALLPYVVPAV